MNSFMKTIFAFLSLGLLTGTTFAAIDPALPKCPPDWKVEVIAQKPLLRYPTVVCAAPDGRVFVGQDPMDMPARGDVPIDSILCFHPDGHVTLFATNLYAVFGLAYVDGKLYVHQCPKFTVFTDDNGVGKDPVDLFTTNPNPSNGGGLNDHIPSNMRLAMDGYFYMSTGDKGIFGAVGKDGSKVDLRGGGLMRFRPDGTQLEVYSTGTRNHLDVALNSEDEMFTYDNTDDGNGWWTRVTHMVDGGFYGYPYNYKPQRPYTLWMMTDYGGGSPTGSLTYNEDALPEEYRGNLFLSEWGRKQFLRLKVSREGGSYKVDSRQDFLTSGTEDFRPIGIAVAPDGMSLFIGDWNVSGWKKPDVAGRLLKVSYTGPSLAAPKPVWWLAAATGKKFEATTDELIAGLKHPAQMVRLVAQRRLAERGPDASLRLIALLKDSTAPALARMHALWTLDAIDGGAASRTDILSLLKEKDDSVRAQVVRQLGTRRSREALKPLLPLLADRDPVIRFRIATALGRIADASAVPALVAALDEKDFFTRYAIFTALNRIGRADYFAWAEIVKGFNSSNPRIREGVSFAMRETYDEANVKALADFVASPGSPEQARATALGILAELYRKFPACTGNWWATQPVAAPPPVKSVDWPGSASVLSAVRAALTASSAFVRLEAVDAIGTLGDVESAPNLRRAFEQESDLSNRQAIIRTLGLLHDTASDDLLVRILADDRDDVALLPEAIDAAGRIGDNTMVQSLNHGVFLAKRLYSESMEHMARKVAWNSLLPRVIEALGNTKSPTAVPSLAALVRNPDSKTRGPANLALQHIGGEATRDAVLPLLKDSDVALRRVAIEILGSLRDKKLNPLLTEAYRNNETREVAVLALTRSPDLASLDIFLECLDDRNSTVKKEVYNAMKSLADRALKTIETRQETEPFNRGQLTALRRLYERNAAARTGPLFAGVAKPLETAAYGAYAEKHSGDSKNGSKIFNDLTHAACVKCHRVRGQGGQVGPELTGVGSKYNRAQLIESVLYPSKQILDGYHQTVVTLNDGETVSGIVRGESATEVNLVDSDGKIIVVHKTDLKGRKESELSLMPEGLQASLSVQDFADLASFLESLKEPAAAAKP
jgi:putative membrane-bound dehydrogenase-like protein